MGSGRIQFGVADGGSAKLAVFGPPPPCRTWPPAHAVSTRLPRERQHSTAANRPSFRRIPPHFQQNCCKSTCWDFSADYTHGGHQVNRRGSRFLDTCARNVSTMHGLEASAARVVELVAAGRATARNELAAGLGLPPSTVNLRVQALLAAGVLVERGEGRSHGGRRPRLLTVNPDFGHVWTIDIGSRHVRLGPMDMTGALISTHEVPISIDADPSLLLGEISVAV